MKQYLEALRHVRDTGTQVTNRTGIDTLRTWGYQMRFDTVAEITGRIARNLVVSFSDLHLYVNHLNQVEEQLSREPRALPTVHIPRAYTIDDYGMDPSGFRLVGYDPHPAIKAEVAV